MGATNGTSKEVRRAYIVKGLTPWKGRPVAEGGVAGETVHCLTPPVVLPTTTADGAPQKITWVCQLWKVTSLADPLPLRKFSVTPILCRSFLEVNPEHFVWKSTSVCIHFVCVHDSLK